MSGPMHRDSVRETDRDAILAAMGDDGNALYYADASLKRDREIVLAAVNNKGEALADASLQRLRRDPTMILAAVRQNLRALHYVDLACVSSELLQRYRDTGTTDSLGTWVRRQFRLVDRRQSTGLWLLAPGPVMIRILLANCSIYLPEELRTRISLEAAP